MSKISALKCESCGELMEDRDVVVGLTSKLEARLNNDIDALPMHLCRECAIATMRSIALRLSNSSRSDVRTFVRQACTGCGLGKVNSAVTYCSCGNVPKEEHFIIDVCLG